MSIRQAAHKGRAEGAAQIDDKDEANQGLAERVRRSNQRIFDIVIERDKAAHDEKSDQIKTEQFRRLQIFSEPGAKFMGGRAFNDEVIRGGQLHIKPKADKSAEDTDQSDGGLPGIEISGCAYEQTPQEATDGVPTDEYTHDSPCDSRIKFLLNIGHGNCRIAGDQYALQAAQRKQNIKIITKGNKECQNSGPEQRNAHDRLAPL